MALKRSRGVQPGADQRVFTVDVAARSGTARRRLGQVTGKAARLIASGLAYYQSEMGEFGKLDNRL